MAFKGLKTEGCFNKLHFHKMSGHLKIETWDIFILKTTNLELNTYCT